MGTMPSLSKALQSPCCGNPTRLPRWDLPCPWTGAWVLRPTGQKFEARMSYGILAFSEDVTITPELGIAVFDDQATTSLGLSFSPSSLQKGSWEDRAPHGNTCAPCVPIFHSALSWLLPSSSLMSPEPGAGPINRRSNFPQPRGEPQETFRRRDGLLVLAP